MQAQFVSIRLGKVGQTAPENLARVGLKFELASNSSQLHPSRAKWVQPNDAQQLKTWLELARVGTVVWPVRSIPAKELTLASVGLFFCRSILLLLIKFQFTTQCFTAHADASTSHLID